MLDLVDTGLDCWCWVSGLVGLMIAVIIFYLRCSLMVIVFYAGFVDDVGLLMMVEREKENKN